MKQFCIFFLTYLASCTMAYGAEYYPDQPTPAGNSVSAPDSDRSQPVQQEIPRYKEKLPLRGDNTNSVIVPKANKEQLTGIGKSDAAKIIDAFKIQYKKQGNPRIAIFLNRTLRSVEEEKRSASEKHLWAYEDGFMQPFFDAGIHLLDRATLLGLKDLDKGKENAHDPISAQQLEMKALLDQVDIYIELLVSKNIKSPYGYDFKAIAKEVKSGRVLANSTSLAWDWESVKDKAVSVGKNGYETEDIVVVPPLNSVSADLAVSLMDDLTLVWSVSGTPGGYNSNTSISAVAMQKQERNISPAIAKNPEEKSVKQQDLPQSSLTLNNLELYGEYYALLIGIADYQNMTSLKTAIRDVEVVGKVLTEKYGYRTEVLKNASREEIINSLTRYRKKLSRGDNLLIYYAGHGWLDPETKVGYWLPVDSSLDSPAHWISNATITDSIKGLKAKHVMIIADSCYSGTLSRSIVPTINKDYDSEEYWKQLSKKKVRVVLTSGGLEPVSDTGSVNDPNHSVFASALIKQLDINEKIIDGNGLYKRLSPAVLVNSNQTPDFSDMRMAGHEGGDFIFVKK